MGKNGLSINTVHISVLYSDKAAPSATAGLYTGHVSNLKDHHEQATTPPSSSRCCNDKLNTSGLCTSND